MIVVDSRWLASGSVEGRALIAAVDNHTIRKRCNWCRDIRSQKMDPVLSVLTCVEDSTVETSRSRGPSLHPVLERFVVWQTAV